MDVNNLVANLELTEDSLSLNTILVCNGVPVGILELKQEAKYGYSTPVGRKTNIIENEVLFRLKIIPVIETSNNRMYRIESDIISCVYCVENIYDLINILNTIIKSLNITQDGDSSTFRIKYSEPYNIAPYSSSYNISYSADRKFAIYSDGTTAGVRIFTDKNGVYEFGDELEYPVSLSRQVLNITLPLPEISEEERRAYVSLGE